MKTYIILVSLSLIVSINAHKHTSSGYKKSFKKSNYTPPAQQAPVTFKKLNTHTKRTPSLEDRCSLHNCALLLQCMALATPIDDKPNTHTHERRLMTAT